MRIFTKLLVTGLVGAIGAGSFTYLQAGTQPPVVGFATEVQESGDCDDDKRLHDLFANPCDGKKQTGSEK